MNDLLFELIQIAIPSIFISYIYSFTGQPKQFYREAYLLLLTILISFISESMGSALSAIFMKQPITAAFAAGALPLPMILFGGFLVKYTRMPRYLQYLSWFSFLKYGFEGLIVIIYGFDRCEYTYNEFKRANNVSNIIKPKWAEYIPIMLEVLNLKSTDDYNNSEYDTLDSDEKDIITLYNSLIDSEGTQNQLSFNQSMIFRYYDIENDSLLYQCILCMVVYLLIVKIITYFVILLKLKRGP